MDALTEELLRAFDPIGALPLPVAAMRLVAAMLLGGVIGWEREMHSRAAGLRTHMMISLAAAVFAILAMELVHFQSVPGVMLRVDPLRLIEAVTSGVAFLAAGSIVVSGISVRGITTGASMWLCGAIGLACGLGDLSLALLTTVLAMTVLWLIHRLISPMAQRLKKPDRASPAPVSPALPPAPDAASRPGTTVPDPRTTPDPGPPSSGRR